MLSRRLALRLLAALVAVVQGFAPGVASIIDARPAAYAASERSTVHFEEPGSAHAIAHQEHCVLCSVATHLVADPFVPGTPLAGTGVRAWPPRAVWLARHDAALDAAIQSRAPPA